jgi:hypothetical protein
MKPMPARQIGVILILQANNTELLSTWQYISRQVIIIPTVLLIKSRHNTQAPFTLHPIFRIFHTMLILLPLMTGAIFCNATASAYSPTKDNEA